MVVTYFLISRKLHHLLYVQRRYVLLRKSALINQKNGGGLPRSYFAFILQKFLSPVFSYPLPPFKNYLELSPLLDSQELLEVLNG